MNRTAVWVNTHDSGKLLLIALAAIPVLLLAIFGPGASSASLALLVGMALCGVGAYWLGNWKWILIPLVVMLVEILIAIPLSLADPNPGETPISVILEAPFWTGIPALIGAGVGYGIKRGVAAATR
ncbi:MAG: hypothetical protein HGA45_36205 [Chloroflexales bacterium]|nr:hypothetical protein [Chloroflexales bacterium]